MRRLLGRSKLKLTILLFLITLSLLLGRLTFSGLVSSQNQLGQPRQHGRLPNPHMFDIPHDTVSQDQPSQYDTQTAAHGKSNTVGAYGAELFQRVTPKQQFHPGTQTKHRVMPDEEKGRLNGSVSSLVKLKTLNKADLLSVNKTVKNNREKLKKGSLRKALKSGNNDVGRLLPDMADGNFPGPSLSFRSTPIITRASLTNSGLLKTTPDSIINRNLTNLTHSQTGQPVINKDLVSKVPLIPTTPELPNRHSFQFILDANDLCSRKEPPFLLVLVMSIHDHMDVRNAIRQTWASVARGRVWPGRTLEETVKLAFLLGLHQFPERESLLVTENEKYGDIIQENFVDSYYNLSIKMAMGLKWASQYCPGVRFILKADEDTFVNLPMLVEILRQPETPKDTIIGRIMPESKVYRVGKWSVDKKVYAGKVYPPYAAGNTYVIPGSLARKLYKASERHAYIHVEDAFITGLLAKAIGVSHLDVPGFTCQADSAPQTCDFVLDLKISGTKVHMGLMRHIWSQIKKLPSCEDEQII